MSRGFAHLYRRSFFKRWMIGGVVQLLLFFKLHLDRVLTQRTEGEALIPQP